MSKSLSPEEKAEQALAAAAKNLAKMQQKAERFDVREAKKVYLQAFLNMREFPTDKSVILAAEQAYHCLTGRLKSAEIFGNAARKQLLDHWEQEALQKIAVPSGGAPEGETSCDEGRRGCWSRDRTTHATNRLEQAISLWTR